MSARFSFQRFEVFLEVREAIHVLGHLVVLGIGHEDNAIHTAKNELAGGVVNDLARARYRVGISS